MKHSVILLATDDAAVEVAVKAWGASKGCQLQTARTGQDALSLVMDRAPGDELAVVDLDVPAGGRALLRTASGVLPVIAIAWREKPWLSAMVRHRRVGATVNKPVSPEKLRAALARVRQTPPATGSGR
jgi:DNA-binding response OmpR family regulator